MKPERKKHELKKGSGQAAATPAARAWRLNAVCIAGLWLAILLVYSNSFNAGLTLDNQAIIGQDPRLTAVTGENLRLIVGSEYWYPPQASGLYRPLTTLTYLFNSAILGNGVRPAGYHWVNYALHAWNASLLYLLGLALFRRRAPALMLAALWALHPIATESVTNIVGRADLLSAFGTLAGLLCWIRWTGAAGRARVFWLAALALSAAISIFSKESGVVVLAAVALYDIVLLRPASWRSRIPGYAAMVLPCLAYFAIRHRVLGPLPPPFVDFTDNPLVGGDFWTARLTAIGVIGRYLWLLVWPAHLSCDYSYAQIPLFAWLHGAGDWKTIASLFACLALAAAAVYVYRRERVVCFFLAFSAAAIAPVSNLVILIGTIMAERFLYLPAIGILGCAVVAIEAATRRIARARPQLAAAAAAAAVIAISIGFGARTYARNFDWESDQTLWASAVKVCPASSKAHVSAATAGLDTAIQQFGTVFKILDPLPDRWNSAAAYLNGGDMYRRKGDELAAAGDTAGSVAWYHKALDTLLKAQRIQAAVNREWRRQTGAGSDMELGWYELDQAIGRSYLRLGQYGQAAEELSRARERHPAPELAEELSVAYFRGGERRKAGITLLEAILADPGNGRLLSEATDLYRQIDPRGCAAASGSGLNMNCPMVREDACTAAHNMVQLLLENGDTALAGRLRAEAAAGIGCGGW